MTDQPLPEILLVDDVEENLEVLANMLTSDEWDLAFATSGMDALEQLDTHLPQLILLDVNMPEMDGFEVCQRLKANPHTHPIPVIFLTGRTALEDLTRGFQIGAVDYITKPFQRGELLARIQTHLSLYQARSTIDIQNWHMQQQLEVLQTLNALSMALQQADDEPQLLALTGKYLQQLAPLWSGALSLNGVDDAPTASIQWGNWHPAKLEEPSNEAEWEQCISRPLQHQQQNLGSLHLCFHDSRFDQTVATTTATIISLALYNLRLRDELHQQSIHDPLTGLYNRRFLEDQLERELRRAERDNNSVCILMLDLDHFKQINDRFGHTVGDQVLIALANVLGTNIRAEDIVSRTGGEEFIVVLPRTNLQTAIQRAEHLRLSISQIVVDIDEQPIADITASIGVAGFPHHASTSAELMQLADEALYRAKREGRNRVVIVGNHNTLSANR